MTLRRYSMQQITRHAKRRPSGYVEALLSIAAEQDAEGATFDASSPQWQALKDRYRKPDELDPTDPRNFPADCGPCKRRG